MNIDLAQKLKEEMGISESEANRLMDRYFKLMPKVKTLVDASKLKGDSK